MLSKSIPQNLTQKVTMNFLGAKIALFEVHQIQYGYIISWPTYFVYYNVLLNTL